MRFSAACLTLLLFFSVALASCPPVASQGHNYYFLPVPAPNSLGFYMDDVLPSGPLMECNSPCEFFNVPGWPLMECKASCNFFTRPFANSQTVYGITGVIYVEYHVSETQPIPQDSVRLFYCVGGKEWCGWGDYILKGSTPIAFQITAQTPGTTFEKGTSLDFALAYNYPVYSFPNFRPGSFRILFGDREHRSSLVTQELDLEGQPIPEFPSFLIVLPVIIALTILLRREQNQRKKPSS